MKSFLRSTLLVLLLNLVFQQSAFSQNKKIDSLKLVLKSEKVDTARLSLLIALADESTIFDSTMNYLNTAVKLADKLLIENRENSPAIKKSILANKAAAFHQIAYEIEKRGNVEEAILYWERSLKISEEIGNKLEAAYTLGSIAYVYTTQHDYQKAIDIYLRNLDFYLKIGNKAKIADMYNNLGVMNRQLGNVNDAFKYWERCLKMQEELGDKFDLGITHYNMAMAYMDKKNLDKALDHYFKSLDMNRQIDDIDGVSLALSGISDVYCEKKNYNMSLAYIDSALTLSKQLGLASNLKATEKVAYNVFAAAGDFKKAFVHYKEYVKYADSLTNEKTRKATIKNQLKFEYEKKEAIIKEQQEKERAVAEEKDRFQKIVILSVVVGLLLVLVFAVFIFRSLKVTKQQKHIIEEKQKEILDSIRYAKRIQNSLLPTDRYIDKVLSGNKKDGNAKH
ncbi:MAG: tetratricopeptide repeat protein [Bacteroidia bacterium]|nr:tetratricopeptide repeat protein [Bacteroidia bacterium]